MTAASAMRDALFRLRQLCWIALVAAVFMLIDSDFVIFLAALIAIVIVAFETRAPVRALGLDRPRSIVTTLALGVAAGFVMLFFSKLLLTQAHVAVAPGVGFGEEGEGFVRIALVENEQRLRQAARGVKKLLSA